VLTPLSDTASEQCFLLTIPLELRLKIYRLVQETDHEDQDNNTPVLPVGERRIVRRAVRDARRNRYSLINFNEKYFALSKTCVQTRIEMQTLLANPTYHFASADALGSFLGDRGGSINDLSLDKRAFRVLDSASSVMLSMNNGDLSRHQLWRIASALAQPFVMTFINEHDADREIRDAVAIWTALFRRFEGGH
jgi:hypothetical protein